MGKITNKTIYVVEIHKGNKTARIFDIKLDYVHQVKFWAKGIREFYTTKKEALAWKKDLSKAGYSTVLSIDRMI